MKKMNQSISTKTNDINDFRFYERISFDHLNHIMQLQSKGFLVNDNFPLIQYCNTRVIKNHIKFSRLILPTLEKDKKYLNIGMGGGFLEYLAKDYDIDSVEWDVQEKGFRSLRKSLDVEHHLKHIIPDINNNEFKIDTDIRYDYVILARFYPINKKWAVTKERFLELLNKFAPYAQGVIICDSIGNYKPDWLDGFKILSHGDSNGFSTMVANIIPKN